MRRAWSTIVGLLALAASAPETAAQGGPALTAQQQRGRQFFTQSCLVCHARPQITAGLYGPPLSRESAGGQADVMRAFITEGTPRMPAFKHNFTPGDIDAIVQYLKTVPKPASSGAGAKGESPVD